MSESVPKMPNNVEVVSAWRERKEQAPQATLNLLQERGLVLNEEGLSLDNLQTLLQQLRTLETEFVADGELVPETAYIAREVSVYRNRIEEKIKFEIKNPKPGFVYLAANNNVAPVAKQAA